jgi:hypothetical protein
MGTLLLRFQQLRSGLPSLNVAVPALKMIHMKLRPKSATSEIIEQVYDMVLDDRRMKVREIAETVDISKDHVGYNADKAIYRSRFEMRMQGEVTIQTPITIVILKVWKSSNIWELP